MVFGSDLKIDLSGRVTLGPDTMKACKIAVDLCHDSGNGSTIIATAGAPPKEKWGDIWMAKMMMEYMFSQNRHLRYKMEMAKTFNTRGEAKALADILPKQITSMRCRVDDITIIAKDWHISRCKMLVAHFLKIRGIQLPIVLESYESHASWWTIKVRERCAYVKDWFANRLLRQ